MNIQIAGKKAWTAVAFQRPTHMVRNVMLPGAMGYGLQYTDNRICIVGGGYPLMDAEGDVVGGIGVSGGTVEEDHECCLAAMRKLGFMTDFEDPFAGVSVKDKGR